MHDGISHNSLNLGFWNFRFLVPGLKVLCSGLPYSWKADVQSVLRACTAVRDFSSREGQPFHVRFLLQGVALYAFRSPSKSMRHLYVKDILQFLKTGDGADHLYSCKALQELVSDKGLGRCGCLQSGAGGQKSGCSELSRSPRSSQRSH